MCCSRGWPVDWQGFQGLEIVQQSHSDGLSWVVQWWHWYS